VAATPSTYALFVMSVLFVALVVMVPAVIVTVLATKFVVFT